MEIKLINPNNQCEKLCGKFHAAVLNDTQFVCPLMLECMPNKV